MLLCQLGLGELSRGLDDDLRPYRRPVQLRRVLLGEDLDLLAIDGNRVRLSGNLVGKIAQDRVVLQKMGQCLGIGEIVDGNEIQIRIVESCAKNIPANAAKTV